MTTHSSILVWKILWAEEPAGLRSMGGHKESDTVEQLTLSWGFPGDASGKESTC